ncbi:MAG: protein kinase, partial [Myxococcota bacterium]
MNEPAREGPYKLLQPLGRGGMGTVWLAEDERDGSKVALKRLNTPSARMMRRFRGEIRTLQRLDHPGVVELLDHGASADGVPWYAMRLLRGRPLTDRLVQERLRWSRSTVGADPTPSGDQTLRLDPPPDTPHWTSRLRQVDRLATMEPTLPPPARDTSSSAIDLSRLGRASTLTALEGVSSPDEEESQTQDAARAFHIPQHARAQRCWPSPRGAELLGWMAQLCRTLAYVHGEGVVHCDIKPENIVLTEDGDAVLVDFGIAEHFGARVAPEVLEVAGEQAGTAHYIAPEQIMGERVDARTDLYALGCVLYEILTGDVPFRDPDPGVVVRQHLEVTPKPPSEWVRHIPAVLDTLCKDLLTKEPSARLGHALGVAHTLEGAGAQSKSWGRQAPSPRAYLYIAGLSGRGDILRHLERDVLGVRRRGAGCVWALGGESGVGKSRIAAEVIGWARHQGVVALTGQSAQVSAKRRRDASAQPLHVFDPVLRMVADLCVQGGQEATSHLLGECGKILAPHAPYFTTLPGLSDLPDPTPVGVRDARLRVFLAMEELLATLSDRRPMLLVLDDLQWADELSIACIEHLMDAVSEPASRPWMLLLLYSSEEIPDALDVLLTRQDVCDARLERLGEADVSVVVARMLGLREAPEHLAREIFRQTEGNPFYVAEFLKSALEASLLELDEDGRWHLGGSTDDLHLTTPTSIDDLVTGRLQRLPGSARAVAQAAAVIGREAHLDVLRELTHMPEDALLRELIVLERREFITTSEGSDGLSFVHDKLREAAYASVSEDARAAMHRDVARMLTERHAPPGVLGAHWASGGRPELARAAFLEGARRAVAQFALGDAESLLVDAIELTEDPDASHALQLELARDVWLPLGRTEHAVRTLERVVRDAGRTSSRGHPELRAR